MSDRPEAPEAMSLDQQLLQVVRKKHDDYTPIDLDEVKRLIESGANPSYLERKDGTWGARDVIGPLHVVIRELSKTLYGRYREGESNEMFPESERINTEVLKYLIAAGADINAKKEHYDWRGCGGSESALEMLVPLACSTSSPSLLKLALHHGGDANAVDRTDRHSMRTDGHTSTPLICRIAAAGSLECLKVVVEAGARVNVQESLQMMNERGYNSDTSQTPLHVVCASSRWEGDEQLEAVHMLLKAGAHVNAEMHWLQQVELEGVQSPTDDPRDPAYEYSVACVKQREHALHIALRQGKVRLATLLYFWGGDLSAARMDGEKEMTCGELVRELSSRDNAPENLESLFKWDAALHRFLPEHSRQVVREVLLVAARGGWQLPHELLSEIYSRALPIDNADTAQEAETGRPGVRFWRRIIREGRARLINRGAPRVLDRYFKPG